MKQLLFIIFGLFCSLGIQAQNISVQSFRLDEGDINAVKNRVLDMNGQKCALIKVETTQQGFSFDRVVKTEQKVGEIWVYVPEGTNRLTISHNQYGILRGYNLGQSLKGGYTYILQLTTNNQIATRTPTPEETYNKGLEYFKAKDYKTAFNYFTEAAQKGYFKAQNHLGTMYHTGLGVNKNDKEAVKWFRKAADQGDVFAMFSMGNMYENGYGIAKDYSKAEEWYKKALVKDPNNTTAKKSLASVQKKIAEQDKSIALDNTNLVSDVDKNIPIINKVNSNTLAIIIANEDYDEASKVEYALNDGKVFRDYCHKTLGLPEDNIHFVANATLTKLWFELDWLQKACKYFKGEASVIFYYAGHGFPDEETKSSYLLPTDGDSRMLRTSLSLNELYNTLGSLSAKKVTVVMDACFSGAKRSGDALNLNDRTPYIKARPGELKGNMIVLSAAQGSETAYKYEDAKHGLFTYFLLKKLKDTKGNVSIGELSNYVQDQVGRYSILKNRKSQTPTIQASRDLPNSWQNFTFY